MQPGFDPNYNPAGNTQYNQPMPNQYNPSMGMQPTMQPGVIIQQPAGSSAGKIVMIVGIVIGILVIGSIILSGILYIWASSLASESQTTSSVFNVYKVEDHASSISDNEDDKLIRLSWELSNQDLDWRFLTINIYEENDLSGYEIEFECSISNDFDCIISEQIPDDAWGAKEVLILSENNQDICSSSSHEDCVVRVEVTYKGEQIQWSQKNEVLVT